MKPSMDELREDASLLTEFNRTQIETIRKEAEEVKKCFTTQTHQALIVSATIMGLGAQFSSDPKVGCYILAIPAIFVIILCLATARIGCHKYNTANRTTAYQIHLARVVDYVENTPGRRQIARELRRVDWEEAMFAWRIIQPAIFSYFYIEHRHIGLYLKRFKWHNGIRWCLRRFKWRKQLEKITDPSVASNVEAYPWYDTRELLAPQAKKLSPARAVFYPGTYLKKMLRVLYLVVLVCVVILCRSLYHAIVDDPSSLNYRIMGVTVLVVLAYVVTRVLSTSALCGILESGLLSIQTSAFVWRIVTISHLIAKLNAQEANNTRTSGTPSQPYNGYTCALAAVVSTDLCRNLHRIHNWLDEKERELMPKLPEDPPSDKAVRVIVQDA